MTSSEKRLAPECRPHCVKKFIRSNLMVLMIITGAILGFVIGLGINSSVQDLQQPDRYMSGLKINLFMKTRKFRPRLVLIWVHTLSTPNIDMCLKCFFWSELIWGTSRASDLADVTEAEWRWRWKMLEMFAVLNIFVRRSEDSCTFIVYFDLKNLADSLIGESFL